MVAPQVGHSLVLAEIQFDVSESSSHFLIHFLKSHKKNNTYLTRDSKLVLGEISSEKEQKTIPQRNAEATPFSLTQQHNLCPGQAERKAKSVKITLR